MALELPPEILKIITSHINVDDLLALWKTGNRYLRRSISNGGVDTLIMFDDIRFPRVAWPEAVSQWRSIRHVELHTSSPTVPFAQTVGAKIKALPSQLQTLKLKTPEAESILREFGEDERRELDRLYQSFRASAIDKNSIPDSYTPQMMNLAAIFPELTTLVIVGEDAYFHSHDALTLPPNLTSLIWNNDLLDDDVLVHLPNTLKELSFRGQRLEMNLTKFNSKSRHPKWKTLLPPHLTRLKWPVPPRAQLTAELAEQMPQKLESLDLLGKSLSVASSCPLTFLYRLPSSLTDVKVGYWDCSNATPLFKNKTGPFLPNLKEIHLLIRPNAEDRTLEGIPSPTPPVLLELPSTLDSLSLKSMNRIGSYRDLYDLPPSLRTLQLLGEWNLARSNDGQRLGEGETKNGGLDDDDGCNFLPPSLTDLDIPWIGGGSDIGLTLQGHGWPKGLTRLSFAGISSMPSSIIRAKIDLPPTLLILIISLIKPGDESYLPPSLEFLKVNIASKLDWGKLPKRLKTLQMGTATLPTVQTVKQLPPTLIEFSIVQQSSDEVNTALKELAWPETLQILRLPGFKHPVDVADAQSLPRGLISLILPDVQEFEDLAVEYLPRNLETLDVKMARFSRNLCFSHLPRTLTFLDLSSMVSVKSKDVPNLPRRLKTLLFGIGARDCFTAQSWPHFPLSLTTWNIPDETGSSLLYISGIASKYMTYKGPYERGKPKHENRSSGPSSCSIQ